MERKTGRTVRVSEEIRTSESLVSTTRSFDAFVPHPLPPDPPLEFQPKDYVLLERAEDSIKQLKSISGLLPDISHLLYAFVRKEAVLSSQIEGIETSLSDLLRHESKQAPGIPLTDVQEVSRCVTAIDLGLKLLAGGEPLSVESLKKIHAELLREGRGSKLDPGELRKRQVWIGGRNVLGGEIIRFVPPPSGLVPECMEKFEEFLQDRSMHPLIRAGLAHVQFETIHPFSDGNGRVGRLLITLMLIAEGQLKEPIFYPSVYFKQYRPEYYERLLRVRTHGDWEGWMRYFLNGVHVASNDAFHSTRRILELFDRNLQAVHGLDRAAGATVAVFESLKRKPIMGVQEIAKKTGFTEQAVAESLERLSRLDIVREITNKKRNRVFVYAPYVAILGEGIISEEKIEIISEKVEEVDGGASDKKDEDPDDGPDIG